MFPLRQLTRQTARILTACRPMSASAGPLVDVADDGGVAVMTLQRPPVNSLNLEILQAMSKALDDAAKNKPKGLILTSASPTVFSAGLDIMEMYKPDLKRAEQFWTTLQDVWIKLFGFKSATAAAINGHSPAGGCLLAMSCEYRVMVSGKYTIGLNETALGIVAAPWFMDTMCHTIRTREAELALTTGKLFTVDEAFKGLANVFSAGVDITEVYKPDLKRLVQFSTAHQDVWIKLFGFPFATAAAINGHSPAGGCLMAMSCEYRTMVTGKYKIGLNEVALGLIANDWFMDTMLYTINTTRDTELALTTGKLFTVDEALGVGLIDEIASDKTDAIEKCKKFIKQFDKILPIERTTTKLRMRQDLLERMHKNRQQDTAENLEFIQRPEVQRQLGIYMQSLKEKAANKSK